MRTIDTTSETTTRKSAAADEPARPRRRRRGSRVGLLAVLLGLLSALILHPSAANAADMGDDVHTVASGDYSCSSQTVDILPMTNEPVTGDYSVWAYASVWEDGRGWVSGSEWTLVDGITTLEFSGVTSQPDEWAKITYARYYDNDWHYASDWIQLSNDLDNFALFC